ncbi:MAG: substrate-binding domain-containing protein [Chloroflexi bacterium]|nr:substrate-binding domain-containing protein [Chloroflexota bacterium]
MMFVRGATLSVGALLALVSGLVQIPVVGAAPTAAPQVTAVDLPMASTTLAQQSCSPGSEEYVWISAISTLPLFVARDHPAMYQAAQQLGVCARVAGPTNFDLTGMIATIEQECAGHPAGVMIVGLDASLAPAIDKCIDQKVPAVTIDVDVPTSKRLSFIGGDFYNLGLQVGQHMVLEQKRAGRSSGDIAITDKVGVPSNVQIVQGATDAIKAGGFNMVAEEDDNNSADGGATAEAALISAYPNLVGTLHFNSESGVGAVQAVNEAGKSGQILVGAGEHDVDFARKIQTNELSFFFGPAREKHTWYGMMALYDFNHPKIVIDGLDKWQAPPIPAFYDVGLAIVNKDNIDQFLSAHR